MRRSHLRRSTLAVGACMALCAPLPAASQAVSELKQGQAVSGALDGGDFLLSDGHLVDAYTFQGMAGQVISATLRSPDFDAYLVLTRDLGPFTEELAADDDGAGGTDSRVMHALPGDGEYLLLVRGLQTDAAGDYTLDLGTAELGTAAVTGMTIGETRVGELDTDDAIAPGNLAHYEIFTFAGRAGDRVRVTLRSEAFDAMLEMGAWDGQWLDVSASNDDAFPDNTDSRIAATLPHDGEYAVRVTSLSPGETGAFTFSIEPGPPEPEPQPIRAGQSVEGELSADDPDTGDGGGYYDLYAYRGTPGEVVAVTLRSSAFDAYLAAGARDAVGAWSELAADDDSAGGTDSEVRVAVPDTGVLLIRARALSAGESGRYALSVRSGG